MSVYTTVGRAELAAWLAPLGLGELIDFAGIAAGVQNSNYFVTTTQGRWVLTLYESLAVERLDFCLGLMQQLASDGFPCPAPLADVDGHFRRPLCGQPAALLRFLSGELIETPGIAHCQQLGRTLGELHRAANRHESRLPNPCGTAWRLRTANRLWSCIGEAEADLLRQALLEDAALPWLTLPRGLIHADLFRDNVLWSDGQLAGVLDFYFAGEDALLYDLAVAANDWCEDDAAVTALLDGYELVRPLTAAEREIWPAMRRMAALRFWLLRLERKHFPPAGEVVTLKDPEPLRQLLVRLSLADSAVRR